MDAAKWAVAPVEALATAAAMQEAACEGQGEGGAVACAARRRALLRQPDACAAAAAAGGGGQVVSLEVVLALPSTANLTFYRCAAKRQLSWVEWTRVP
jgi:hypothetical protein